jgi:hypothetical protein
MSRRGARSSPEQFACETLRLNRSEISRNDFWADQPALIDRSSKWGRELAESWKIVGAFTKLREFQHAFSQ